MLKIDEGHIKFNLEWIPGDALPTEVLEDMIWWRNKLYVMGLIGAYANGVGFGNLSKRYGNESQFIITGTQTGHIPKIIARFFTHVIEVDISQNRLICKGPVKASSESMTHAMLFQADPNINAVIHVHDKFLWNSNKNKLPTTSKSATYGSPEMVQAIDDLCKQGKLDSEKMIIMGGHEGGVLAFGESVEEAGKTLMKYA